MFYQYQCSTLSAFDLLVFITKSCLKRLWHFLSSVFFALICGFEATCSDPEEEVSIEVVELMEERMEPEILVLVRGQGNLDEKDQKIRGLTNFRSPQSPTCACRSPYP